MRRIRSHLTYANVMATLAVFLVLGGGTALAAYVVSSNSQVGPGTISGHKPPSGDHANIVGGSINGTDLATGAVTQGKLGANSVNSGKVVDGSLVAGDTNASSIQHRLDGGCASGQAISAVAQGGASTCTPVGFTQVTVRSATGIKNTASVACQAGETVVGGGGDGHGGALQISIPASSGQGWIADTTTGGPTPTAYALCAK